MSLLTFIDEVIAVIKTVQGIRQAGHDPSALKSWPAAPVYSVSGRAYGEMGTIQHYRHNIRIGLLGPYDGDTQKKSEALVALLEPLVEALTEKMLAQGFSTVDNFGDIDYVFGPIEWAGQVHFGFLLTIYDVKIRRVIS